MIGDHSLAFITVYSIYQYSLVLGNFWLYNKIKTHREQYVYIDDNRLKVHKIENFFGSEIEFYTISLLVGLKYKGFVKKFF